MAQTVILTADDLALSPVEDSGWLRRLGSWDELREVCATIIDSAHEADCWFDVVGGPGMTGTPLAVGVALLSDSAWFIVRPEAKRRGTKHQIEGARLDRECRVLLVNTTVSETLLGAVRPVEASGAEIVGVATLAGDGDCRFVGAHDLEALL